MESPEDIVRHFLNHNYARGGGATLMAPGPLAAIAAVRDLCRLSLVEARRVVEQVRAQQALKASRLADGSATREAHLVLFLDTRQSPPTVFSGGIYSETTPTSSFRGAYPVLLATQSGPDYDTAAERLYAGLAKNPTMKWAFDLIKDRP